MFAALKKLLPTVEEVQQYRYIHIFGDSLKQAELWTFSRQSTANGIAIGVFCAFLPMPFQMVPAIFLASLMRGNLPLAVACAWISNPITWVPFYTPPYQLGTYLLGIDPIALNEISVLALGGHYVALWLGCLIIGIGVSIALHFLVSFIWRSQVRSRWRQRRKRRSKKSNS